MRARTTWNPEQILQRTSATNRVADPYAMNQDHIKQQPSADQYLTGDPSAFAEDITTPNEWNPEYSGGAVKRNEIGLPEVRPETFNHPEKTASINHEAVLKKANIATAIARRLLGANATEVAVEEQAAALMHLPDQEMINTANRLAGEMPPALKQHMEEKKEQGGQQSSKKEEAGQDQGQEQQKQAALALAGGDVKVAQALMIMLGTLKKGNDPQQAPMQQQAQGQQQQAPAQQQAGQQQQSAQDQQSAWYDSKGQRPGHTGPDTGPYAGQQQMPMQQQAQQPCGPMQQQAQPQQQMPMQQQAQPQQQMPVQQAGQQQQTIEAEVQQMIQQAAQQQAKQANGQQQAPVQQQAQQQMPVQQAQQQMPVQQQAGQQQFPGGQFPTAQQQMPMQQQQAGLTNPNQGVSPNYAGQQVQASDDQLIDQMLMGPGGQAAPSGAPIAEMDIQMEAPNMDIGDVQFAPGEDAMLKQLFASGDEAMAAQQAQDAQQGQQQGQVQANVHGVRTAAARTYGTRPMGGVSRIGGAGAPPSRGAEVDKLTSLWQTAPDVREAFGLKMT